MLAHTIRRVLATCILLLSVILLVWAMLPGKREVATLVLSPFEMKMTSGSAGSTPAILEDRRVTLEWPSSMRIGDKGIINLTFDVNAGGNPTPSLASGASNEGGNGQSLTNVYITHNVMLEGRFEVAGMRVDPANPISESLPEGQPVSFKWEVSMPQAGSYECTLWLTLHFLPLDGSEASHQPIYARRIKIDNTSLLGIGGSAVRLLGAGGILLSGCVVFDDMIGVVKNLKRKITTKDMKRKITTKDMQRKITTKECAKSTPQSTMDTKDL